MMCSLRGWCGLPAACCGSGGGGSSAAGGCRGEHGVDDLDEGVAGLHVRVDDAGGSGAIAGQQLDG